MKAKTVILSFAVLVYLAGCESEKHPVAPESLDNSTLGAAVVESSLPYQIIDIGTLGGVESRALDINERGQIVGSSYDSQGEQRAFLWENGVMTDLGSLDWPPGEATGANAINNRGQVVGWSHGRAFIWEKGKMTDLGSLPDRFNAVAMAINERGQVVGYVSSANERKRAFLWENGVMTDLGTLGGEESEADDINNRGQVIGWSMTTSGVEHGCLWENGRIIDLGTLGGETSFARCINERGDVVGNSQESGGSPQAFKWVNGEMSNLGMLLPCAQWSQAEGINNAGIVVGGRYCPGKGIHAILWDRENAADLGTLGGTWSVGWEINSRGQVAGWSRTSAGAIHACLWDRNGNAAKQSQGAVGDHH